jgi:type IV fimbrial biogenesis protein FimT
MRGSWLHPAGQRGMSFVEVLISLVILVILILVGVPGFTEWLNNGQIRTATESILSGLQTARNEAVRRNANVQLTLTNPGVTGGTGWSVALASTQAVIQSAPNAEGAAQTLVTPTPGDATTITFTGVGRTPAPPNNLNIDGSSLLTQIDIDSTVLAADTSRNLRILISTGGQIRMCDPNVTNATDPRAC